MSLLHKELDIRYLSKGTDFLSIQWWRETQGGELNLPNPYKGMKPQKPDFSYTPKGLTPSSIVATNEKPFDPNGIYPNLLGHLHPGPEGNFIPTFELIKAK